MRKEFTINYRSQWDNNWTHYNQTINITRKTLDQLKDKIQAEVLCPSNDDIYFKLYIKNSFWEIKNWFVFMNLTQRDFFNKTLKLELKDRNTCFYIID